MYPGNMLQAPTLIKMVLIKMVLWYYYVNHNTISNQCHTVGKHFPPHIKWSIQVKFYYFVQVISVKKNL